MNRYLFAILYVFPFLLQAQINTDRPDQTESSATLNKGDFQLESGVQLNTSENIFGNTINNWVTPTSLFRMSLTENVELRFVNQLETTNGRTGISDLQIGAKIQLFQKEESKTEIAFLAHAIVPTGSAFLSNDELGLFSRFLVSHQLSDDLSLGYNIGYDNNCGDHDGNITFTLALAKSINDKVGVYIEPFGEYQDFENFVLNFDAGFTYLLNPNTQLDFSFASGITDDMNYIALGCSWLFEKN